MPVKKILLLTAALAAAPLAAPGAAPGAETVIPAAVALFYDGLTAAPGKDAAALQQRGGVLAGRGGQAVVEQRDRGRDHGLGPRCGPRCGERCGGECGRQQEDLFHGHLRGG